MGNQHTAAALIPLQPRSLAECEAVIERGQQTFVEVGQALLEIRDRRLYREQGHATFEAYCRQRWRFSRIRAYQLIEAAEVVGLLTIVDTPCQHPDDAVLPANEGQARELVPLLRAAPEAVPEVWREVVAAAPSSDGTPRVTAAQVEVAVRARREATSHAEAHAARREAYQEQAAQRAAALPSEALPFGRVVQVDALAFLQTLPAACADLCVTSPPYWAKRTYSPNNPRELGQEVAPAVYIARLLDVLAELERVLVPEGWLFLNLGDTYASQPGQYRGDPDRARGISQAGQRAAGTAPAERQWDVPDKSLCLIPWRVVSTLVLERRWRCRNVITWHKGGHQPENVHDRLTQAWEPVFALTRAAFPYFARGAGEVDVWEIAVGRGGAAKGHLAPFPDALVERILQHACPPGGVVLDPFAGSGTVRDVVARRGCRFLGCDLLAAADPGAAASVSDQEARDA